MASILVNAHGSAQVKLVRSVLKKMGIESTVLSASDAEDIALGLLMSKVDRTKKVSRSAVMKKLASKE
ncbi:MAG: hypothetical protein JSS75_01755 [Bacteroidetes bacterium]|nr:hypothetical protein [Bacteroidota bacterium]